MWNFNTYFVWISIINYSSLNFESNLTHEESIKFGFWHLVFYFLLITTNLEVGGRKYVISAKILNFTLKNFVFLQKSVFCKNLYKIPYQYG